MKAEHDTKERPLVVAVSGLPGLVTRLRGEPQLVALQLAGGAMELARRPILEPNSVDAAILDAGGADREEVVELARILRAKLLGVVLVVPLDRWGKVTFRNHIGVFRRGPQLDLQELWTALTLAAHTTYVLKRLDPHRPRPVTEVDRRQSPARVVPGPPIRAMTVVRDE